MKRPILIGVAEEIQAPVMEQVKKVIEVEGFYIATDVNTQGAEIPLVVLSGKIYSMKVDDELNPSRFLDTVRFNGPFRADINT